MIELTSFSSTGSTNESLCIHIQDELNSITALDIRKTIDQHLITNNTVAKFYINASNVTGVELPGINELIHSHYRLQQAAQHLVLVYRRQSIVEKWIATTQLDRFIATAIVL